MKTKWIGMILVTGLAVSASVQRVSTGSEVAGYLQQARAAATLGRNDSMNSVLSEGEFREAGLFANLALSRARAAGWSSAEREPIEQLAVVYGGQYTFAHTRDLVSQGPLQQTNNPYDLCIEGKGFFELSSPSGEKVYTRNGCFHYDARTNQALDGVGNGLDLRLPKDVTNVEVSPDGTVRATHLLGDGKPEQFGVIQLATFWEPRALRRVRGRLYQPTPESGPPRRVQPGAEGAGTLAQGHLEANWMEAPARP